MQGIMQGIDIARQGFADSVYYLTLNFIGIYVRYVGEINMRRGFLDKRGCIETTFKLKYEKEQEVCVRVSTKAAETRYRVTFYDQNLSLSGELAVEHHPKTNRDSSTRRNLEPFGEDQDHRLVDTSVQVSMGRQSVRKLV